MAMTTSWQCPHCGSVVVSEQMPQTQGCPGNPQQQHAQQPSAHAWEAVTDQESNAEQNS